MPHVGGQQGQLDLHVGADLIPPQQGPNGEAVAFMPRAA